MAKLSPILLFLSSFFFPFYRPHHQHYTTAAAFTFHFCCTSSLAVDDIIRYIKKADSTQRKKEEQLIHFLIFPCSLSLYFQHDHLLFILYHRRPHFRLLSLLLVFLLEHYKGYHFTLLRRQINE